MSTHLVSNSLMESSFIPRARGLKSMLFKFIMYPCRIVFAVTKNASGYISATGTHQSTSTDRKALIIGNLSVTCGTPQNNLLLTLSKMHVNVRNFMKLPHSVGVKTIPRFCLILANSAARIDI